MRKEGALRLLAAESGTTSISRRVHAVGLHIFFFSFTHVPEDKVMVAVC